MDKLIVLCGLITVKQTNDIAGDNTCTARIPFSYVPLTLSTF